MSLDPGDIDVPVGHGCELISRFAELVLATLTLWIYTVSRALPHIRREDVIRPSVSYLTLASASYCLSA